MCLIACQCFITRLDNIFRPVSLVTKFWQANNQRTPRTQSSSKFFSFWIPCSFPLPPAFPITVHANLLFHSFKEESSFVFLKEGKKIGFVLHDLFLIYFFLLFPPFCKKVGVQNAHLNLLEEKIIVFMNKEFI